MEKVKSPFDGEPRTVHGTDDNGNPALFVTARAVTPLRARIADACTAIAILHCWGIGLTMLQREAQDAISIGLMVGFIAAPVLARSAIRRFCHDCLAKTSEVAFTERTFAVRRPDGWEVYDRQLPHRFALIAHDRAQAERDQHDYEKQQASINRAAVMPTRYYGDSFVLSFEHLGQRNDVLVVYGPKQAQAILARLTLCDNIMDAQLQKGKGVPLEPADQWGRQPGDIPELA